MADGIPAVKGYSWGDNPYNEGKGNGGEFQNSTVSLDFIRNFIDRTLIYGAQYNKWCNFCTYTNSSGAVVDKGTPSVAGKFQGVCSLERDSRSGAKKKASPILWIGLVLWLTIICKQYYVN